MDCIARSCFLNSSQQLVLECPVVDKLVFGDVDNDNSNLELREVLLELKAAVNRHQNVKRPLCDAEQHPVFEGIPPLFVHSGGLVPIKE